MLSNINKLHTNRLGIERIKRNLNIDCDVVNYLKNSYNYCIITAHIKR